MFTTYFNKLPKIAYTNDDLYKTYAELTPIPSSIIESIHLQTSFHMTDTY